MADFVFNVGHSSLDAIKVTGTNIPDWSAYAVACAGLDLLTMPGAPNLGEVQSVVYGNSKFNFPVDSGYYDIHIIAYSPNNSQYTLKCKVDGTFKFTNFFPYSAAGNTMKAVARTISGYHVTGDNCEVEISSDAGGGYDPWSFIIFEEVEGPADEDPPEVEIVSPADNAEVDGLVEVEVDCEDVGNGVESLQLKVDGDEYGEPFTGSNLTGHTFEVDTNQLPNGEHELTTVASDGDNETESDPVTIDVQNPPTAGFELPSTGVVGVPVPITNTSANATSYAYDKDNNGSTDSTDAAPSFTYDAPGTYTVKQIVTNVYGSTNTTHNIVISEIAPLNYDFNSNDVELFCEAEALELSDGNNVASFTDQSIHGRNLTASSSYPTFQTAEINGKPVVRFSSSNPLKNTAVFTVRCGWILAKYDGATFPNTSDGYKGLLSDLVDKVILSGKRNTNEFFDVGFDLYEFRSNDRIYSVNDEGELHAPAPMSSFKLIFFRFWTPIEVDGIQLGQELGNTNRKWAGDVALLILTSRDFCERDIRNRSLSIAEAYALTLADVIPYQGSKSDEFTYARAAYVYDPPEGERIAEVLDDCKQSFDLNFSIRSNAEFKKFRAYYRNHYPEVPCVYRDYNILPPEDTEGYFDSELKKSGFLNNNYSVRFKEK